MLLGKYIRVTLRRLPGRMVRPWERRVLAAMWVAGMGTKSAAAFLDRDNCRARKAPEILTSGGLR